MQSEFLFSEFQTELLPEVINIVIFISPILLAVILAGTLWTLWIRYIQARFYASLKYACLELRLPKETFKSPKAMELVLTALHNTSDGGWTAKFWKGEYRPYYSLEIVSVEGHVKFYIWGEDRRKLGVMNALYAQFPGIEIYDGPDYTTGTHFDPKTMKLWAAEFAYTKDAAYPLKTYVDYGLDKDPKEEFKIDPLAPLVEFFGSAGANEQMWLQLIVRAHKGEQKKPGHLFKKYDAWRAGGEKLMDTIMLRDPKTKVQSVGAKWVKGTPHIPVKTNAYEDELVVAIQRSLSKIPFDVGIRAMYISKKDTFNTPFGIGGFISSMKQFSTEHLNGLRPNGEKWIVQFDEPWKDYKDMRRNRISAEAIEAFKRRSFFRPPFESEPLVMNVEELATLYHFPGSVVASPSFERVPSKKAEAPGNLPI